ncbi:ABC transporter permease [Pectinatus brassicae]|uniref:ABC-2 type transport system permease protein n=1 Tax=Pectinatus brassicae TaxID=862415 RepID=A0A840UPS4_9FIRM|nr:ABC transporter permease [Pectinatus brassicae]MBB5336718.1 ABC-2 type transport system permease protein [Pectinatus brassicae]
MKIPIIFMRELSYLFFQNKFGCVLLYAPIFYALFFGSMFSAQTLKHIPIVIYDQDQTASSRMLSQEFYDSERFKIVGMVNTQDDMKRYIDNDEAYLAVEIPNDFSKNIKKHKENHVLLEINAKNMMYSNTIQTYATEIISTYNSQIRLPGVSSPISFTMRMLYNPTAAYTPFLAPGLVAHSIQIAILLTACLAFVREYDARRFLKKFSITAIVIGKLAVYWPLSILSGLIGMGICVEFFNIVMRGSIIDLLLIYSAFTFAICSFGFLLSAAAKNHQQPISPLVLMYIMPSFIYSGYTWPAIAQTMPVRIYSYFLPMTYISNVARDILLVGYSGDLYINSTILYGAGMIMLLATMFICKRRINQSIEENANVSN